MSSASRPPLGSARHDNIIGKGTEPTKDMEARLKKTLASLAEERRKRAEVEGVVDGLRRDKESAGVLRNSISQELSLAQAEIRAQKTTIMRLSAAAVSSSASSLAHAELEAKLQDLIQKHNQSKAKHQAELSDAQTSNLSLQSLISALQTSSTTDRQTITDLRGERAGLKKEVELLRSRPAAPIQDEKADDLSRFKDERRIWREEKMKLEVEVKDLKRRAGDVERLALKVQELEADREKLEGLLHDTAKACSILCWYRVDKGEAMTMRDELILERSARRALERKLRDIKGSDRMLKAENADLTERVQVVMEERDSIAADLDDLLQQRRADRVHPHSRLSSPPTHHLEPLDSASDILSCLDLALHHIDLFSSHTTTTTESYLSSISSLSHNLTHAQSSLSSARTSLSTLQTTHASTSAELDAMLSAHSDCAAQIMDWRAEANRATAQEARLKSELCDVRQRLENVEETMKGEREMLRRANEGSARWGAARVALEDEVQSLRSALEEEHDVRLKYDAISEEVEILRSREAMALEDAERLGIQNAELIGHGNGGQKISYVEGLRREMALVKHELATTRHHLNAASTQITSLTSELDALKSITPSLLASTGTGRVRVARRQPEGGEVLGASVARRSVSTSQAGLWAGR